MKRKTQKPSPPTSPPAFIPTLRKPPVVNRAALCCALAETLLARGLGHKVATDGYYGFILINEMPCDPVHWISTDSAEKMVGWKKNPKEKNAAVKRWAALLPM